MLAPGFWSFFALRSWHNMDDHEGGQNVAVGGKMLGKKTENPTKHIK